MINDLEEMKQLIPTLYNEVSVNVSFEQLPSVSLIKQNRENGKVKFDHARNESDIDPAAPENYETVKTRVRAIR